MFKLDLNGFDTIEEWVCFFYYFNIKWFNLILLQRIEEYEVNDIVPTKKYAHTTAEKAIIGMHSLGFFLINPLVNNNKRKKKKRDSKSYHSHHNLS